MSIVPHNRDFARDQSIRASFEPIDQPTDWDEVVRNAALLDSAKLIEEIKAGEPYDRNEVSELHLFRLQTKIRIHVRHVRGLSQYARHTCSACGQRPAHPVSSRAWVDNECLHCAEKTFLIPKPSRWSDFPLRTAFDPSSSTWGLAYTSEENSQKTGAIIVSGYRTFEDAKLACNASGRFAQIYNRVCPVGLSVDEDSILNFGELFSLSLPMSPDEWRAFLIRNMMKAEPLDATPYESTVRGAIAQFFAATHE